MKSIVFFLFALVQSNLLLALSAPEPKFEVFPSGGFGVSIPDEEGIQLFSFHCSINRSVSRLGVGDISGDVSSKTNGRWVFKDKNTKLKEGDTIYYWFFVMKDGVRYKYDDKMFVVKDIAQEHTHNHPHGSSGQPKTGSNSNDKTSPPTYIPMCEVALNLSNTVDQLTGEVKRLKEINDVLKDIVSRDDASSRTLRFEGILPPFDDATYTAQIILQEKLGLRIPVVNATRETDGGITFQVASLDDKIYVIRTAKEKLEKMQSKIILSY